MKKAINLSAFMMVLLLTFISACGKEEIIKPVISVTDTIRTPDTMPPVTDTTKALDTTIIPAGGFSFLALGDSYTIGQNVQEADRFPAQTVQLLRAQNVEVKTPRYIATTGWTTSNLIAAIQQENPPTNFDIVTLLIGVNNQYQRRDKQQYAEEFEQLLKKAIVFANGKLTHVFVLSIPDYSATPFVGAPDKARVSKEIDEFNAINKTITTKYTVAYIDITPSTRLAAGDNSLVAGDGLHPSGKEYKKWAETLAPIVKKVLK